MFRIGSHVSISGGISTAVDRVLDLGGNCGQIFVGSPQGWTVSDVDEDTAAAFQDATTEHDVGPWIVHGTYLINLATPKDDLGDESLTCVQQELTATATLDIPYYVFHPGSHTGAGVETGLANVATRLSDLDIPDEVTLLLENTAGKGTTVGQRFEHLAAIVEQSVYEYSRIGVCLDTCHLLAAGYDLTSADGLDKMIAALDTSIGVENVQYLISTTRNIRSIPRRTNTNTSVKGKSGTTDSSDSSITISCTTSRWSSKHLTTRKEESGTSRK